MVVQEQVVVFTEQDSASYVGATVIPRPVLDVVGLRPGGRTFAVRPAASAVTLGECDALPGGEESLLPSDVEGLPVIVEHDGDGALSADKSFNGLGREGDLVALESTVTGAGDQIVFGDRDADRGRPTPQELGWVHLGTGGDQSEEDVGGELFGGSRIMRNALSLLLLADKAWSAPSG